MAITREMLEAFREDFADVVKELEVKYGVIISLGRITYGYDSFEGKITAKLGNSKEDVMKKTWEQECGWFGFNKDDFGKQFTANDGKTYEIIGIDSGKRKYPIIIRDTRTGKTVRGTADWVKRFL